MGGGNVPDGFGPGAGVNGGWVVARVHGLVWCGLCGVWGGGGVLCSGPDQSLGWITVRGRVAMMASMDGEESALE